MIRVQISEQFTHAYMKYVSKVQYVLLVYALNTKWIVHECLM